MKINNYNDDCKHPEHKVGMKNESQIKLLISGKEFTIEEAECVYNELKRLFEPCKENFTFCNPTQSQKIEVKDDLDKAFKDAIDKVYEINNKHKKIVPCDPVLIATVFPHFEQ